MSNTKEHIDFSDLVGDTAGMTRLAAMLIDDGAVRDDVVQDARLVLLGRDASTVAHAPAFLRRVLERMAATYRRGARRRDRRERRSARPEATASVLDGALLDERRRLLWDAIGALDPIYRDVIIARYFDELAPTEIAEKTSTNLATVKSRLARALELLRVRLDERFCGDRSAWIRAMSPLAASIRAVESAVRWKTLVAAAMLLGVAFGVVRITRGSADESALRTAPPIEAAAAFGGPRRAPNAHPLPTAQEAPATEPTSAKGIESICEVVVVDDDGKSVPGAQVAVSSPSPADLADAETRRRRSQRRSVEAMLESSSGTFEVVRREGVTATTDGEGRVRISCGEAASIAARRGDAVGYASRTKGEKSVRAVLVTPSMFVDVRVVDALGNAAPRIPVAISRTDRNRLTELRVARYSDDRGRARLEWSDRLPPTKAMIALPLALPVEAEIAPPSERADSPITLRLPATGAVEVLTLDANDHPVPDDTMVRILPVESANAEIESSQNGLRIDAHSAIAFTKDGIARFLRVGLGGRFMAAMQADTRSRIFDYVPFNGPNNTEEPVQVTIRPTSRVVAFNLRGLRGHPVQRVFLDRIRAGTTLGPASRPSRLIHAWPMVEDDGELRWYADLRASDVGEFDLDIMADGGGVTRRIHIDASTRTIDPGDLGFSEAKTLLKGVVLDAAGRPAVGLRVGANFGDADESAPESWSLRSMVQTDGDGRFEIVGSLPEDGGSPRLGVLPKGHLASGLFAPTPDPFAMVVHLRTAAAFECEITAADPTVADFARVELRGADGVWRRSSIYGWGPRARANAVTRVFEGIPAGRYDLRVILDRDVSETTILIHDIVVAEGVTNRDPRTSPLALGDRYSAMQVFAEDEAGQRISARIDSLAADGSTVLGGEAYSAIVLDADHPIRELWVRAEHCISERIAPARGDHRVVLRRMPTSIFRLARPVVPLPPGTALIAHLEREGDVSSIDPLQRTAALSFTAATEFEKVDLLPGGSYTLRWSLRAADTVTDLGHGTSVIPDSSAPQTIAPDAAKLREALERLEKR